MKTLVTFSLGALAMYLLDPQQGSKRRALVRDQLAHASRRMRSRVAGAERELSYREYAMGTQGLGAQPGNPAPAPQSAQHLGR